CPAASSATTRHPRSNGARRSKLPALSSQPCSASTGSPSSRPHSRPASVRPRRAKRRSSGITGSSESRTSPAAALLLERPGAREALGDELLQTLLLLEQARARQQQHPVAGLEPGHDLAVLEIGQPRHDLDRHGTIVSQRNDPVLAAELISARIGRFGHAAARLPPEASGRPVAREASSGSAALRASACPVAE